MKEFMPDYKNVADAARNIQPARIPVYEHNISETIMERIMNRSFLPLYEGNREDKREYFKCYTGFFRQMGYDTVSYERCIGAVMPGSGALGRHTPGVIKNRDDFARYPWDEVPELYFKAYSEDFALLREAMPAGMKAIGGPGNGVFECVQDIVGYTDLCYILTDDPELYRDLFGAVGTLMFSIWKRFMKEYGDIYCVCRFGDDLGFKTNTLLPTEDIKSYIIPEYQRIIGLVHSYGKPFLFHSCGKIFGVMEDLIDVAKIDAKHSNEDQIAPFTEWVELYGSRIGNFGGLDTDDLCRKSEEEVRQTVKAVMGCCTGHGGFALGSGNSIPDYVMPENYLAMLEAARAFRGDFN